MSDPERVKPYEAKKALTSVINRVAIGQRPVIFEARGRDLAALISMEQFHLFERLIEELEDRIDLEEAERALKEPGAEERIPWDALKRELLSH